MCFAVRIAVLIGAYVLRSPGERASEDYDLSLDSSFAEEFQDKCGELSEPSMNVTAAKDKCQKCVDGKSCKWCTLKQFCAPESSEVWFSTVSCDVVIAHDAKNKIKRRSDCAERPPWEKLMLHLYGQNWSDEATHQDAIHCVQWSLGWPLTAPLKQIVTSTGTHMGITVKMNDEKQVEVSDLDPRDLAAKAGLSKGDVITKLNEEPVLDRHKFIEEIERLMKSGANFTLRHLPQNAGEWACTSALLRDGLSRADGKPGDQSCAMWPSWGRARHARLRSGKARRLRNSGTCGT